MEFNIKVVIYMRKKLLKKPITYTAITVFLIILLIFLINQRRDIESVRTERELLPGQIAFGIYSKDNKIIDSGSLIKDKKITHRLQLSQDLSQSREYLILVLLDYIQTEFKVNNEIYSKYKVSLDKEDTIDVSINMNIPEDAKELCYVIIKKPNYMQIKRDIQKSCILQEFMTLRYSLNTKEKYIDIEKNFKKVDKGPVSNLFLSESAVTLKPVISCAEQSKKELVIGNTSDNPIKYSVIQFLDWNQTPFQDKETIKFFEVNPNSKVSYSVDMPAVTKDSVLQYLAFPYPYNTNRDNFYSTFGVGTFRTTLINND